MRGSREAMASGIVVLTVFEVEGIWWLVTGPEFFAINIFELIPGALSESCDQTKLKWDRRDGFFMMAHIVFSYVEVLCHPYGISPPHRAFSHRFRGGATFFVPSGLLGWTSRDACWSTNRDMH